ncbi:hypothetical protein MMB232_00724 [Brevundimonas subvibrioides]
MQLLWPQPAISHENLQRMMGLSTQRKALSQSVKETLGIYELEQIDDPLCGVLGTAVADIPKMFFDRGSVLLARLRIRTEQRPAALSDSVGPVRKEVALVIRHPALMA